MFPGCAMQTCLREHARTALSAVLDADFVGV
jgi:hypothetical protein